MPIIVDAIMIAVILLAAIVALAELMMPLEAQVAELPSADAGLRDWRALDDIDRRRVRPELVWHDDWTSAGSAR